LALVLWLLRHAEAADGSPDAERELTGRGVEQARAAGAALSRLGVELQLCLTSPKRRARQTAELACSCLEVEIAVEPALSGEPFDPAALAPGLEDVLLVGHDPSFSILLHDLTGVQARLKKGGVAAVHKGELALLMGPRELAAVAGVPTPGGARRPREHGSPSERPRGRRE
jgi:phosphohistidine phosphatase